MVTFFNWTTVLKWRDDRFVSKKDTERTSCV